jgi:hypothetical protein
MIRLKGKNILFFGPKTFNYECEIKNILEENGANVYYLNDKPFTNIFLIAILRISPKLIWFFCDRIYKNQITQFREKHVDIIFVIKGEGLSSNFCKYLRNQYSNAEFILYLWDSIKNIKQIESKTEYFDRIYSFDSIDCLANKNFEYRPLFFIKKYLKGELNYDRKKIFFVGTLNGDRLGVVKNVVRNLNPEINFEYWLYVRSNIEYFFLKTFRLKLLNLDRFIRVPLGANEIQTKFEESNAVLDIEHRNQNGLTMRTFEVLASGKKLITTNRFIANESFYNSLNILIIDRDNPQISSKFLEQRNIEISKDFINKYSLEGWIKDIFRI